MSAIDTKALESNFENWIQERTPTLNKSKAFEIYSIEQILKDSDLSDDELRAGHFGGGDDGGIDGMFLFINRVLILDETPLPDPALTVELVLIQAKYHKSFEEEAVEKLHSFARDLLTYSKPVAKLTYLNSFVRDAIERFRDKYAAVMGSPHTLKVSFHYTTKSINDPNPKVRARVENLKKYVRTQLSAAAVSFDFWDCARMLTSARAIPRQDVVIEIMDHFSTHDGSVVCLVKLDNFAAFLTDDRGNLKTSILEPNVRDYQGKGNPVNADIRATLNDTAAKEEFWWLNNGITVLAEKCPIAGNKMTVVKPEIVNGLQTSHEVFEVYRNKHKDDRTILLRVIIAPDSRTRNKIIKATNSQTAVNPVSLHATDRIHFDIEDRFRLYGLFYDRRKGEYKRLKKPISKIVSIRALAQSLMAALLQRPSDARARPQSLLNNASTYAQIFDETYNRDVYATCILLDRQVDEFLSQSSLSRDEKRDIRYYVSMLTACDLTKSPKPSVSQLVSVIDACKTPIGNSVLTTYKDIALKAYKRLGGTDKVAKGSDLQKRLLAKAKRLWKPEKTKKLRLQRVRRKLRRR
jgi:AIPR protein